MKGKRFGRVHQDDAGLRADQAERLQHHVDRRHQRHRRHQRAEDQEHEAELLAGKDVAREHEGCRRAEAAGSAPSTTAR